MSKKHCRKTEQAKSVVLAEKYKGKMRLFIEAYPFSRKVNENKLLACGYNFHENQIKEEKL